MILGGLVAAFLAVDAEGKSLEDVAKPLSVIAKPPRPSSALMIAAARCPSASMISPKTVDRYWCQVIIPE